MSDLYIKKFTHNMSIFQSYHRNSNVDIDNKIELLDFIYLISVNGLNKIRSDISKKEYHRLLKLNDNTRETLVLLKNLRNNVV